MQAYSELNLVQAALMQTHDASHATLVATEA